MDGNPLEEEPLMPQEVYEDVTAWVPVTKSVPVVVKVPGKHCHTYN
jgi:hypothetical protein